MTMVSHTRRNFSFAAKTSEELMVSVGCEGSAGAQRFPFQCHSYWFSLEIARVCYEREEKLAL